MRRLQLWMTVKEKITWCSIDVESVVTGITVHVDITWNIITGNYLSVIKVLMNHFLLKYLEICFYLFVFFFTLTSFFPLKRTQIFNGQYLHFIVFLWPGSVGVMTWSLHWLITYPKNTTQTPKHQVVLLWTIQPPQQQNKNKIKKCCLKLVTMSEELQPILGVVRSELRQFSCPSQDHTWNIHLNLHSHLWSIYCDFFYIHKPSLA